MAEDEPQEDPGLPRDARLSSLDERLERARRAEAERTGGTDRAQPSFYRSDAYRVLSVLVAYPAGSALIGYAAGRFFGKPLLWVVMLFVGFAIAMWEVWKLSKGAGQGARNG
ncbi:MAG: AtpZ/AtpI family protein [Alphaproteobacteria bacterium]|nr:AtpZ/AtpI family protein [Alphaproteobacteria bacterium]MBV9372817.1 AtpZ/AtpI family protein [Alphaproteobacteria bacterium]MBV9900488.1 AtpZ/AtpI family protein [Alphaproteobacteria bacterium]